MLQEIARVGREAKEGSSEVDVRFLGMVTDLMQISTTSKCASECIAAFKALLDSSWLSWACPILTAFGPAS